MPRNYQLLGIAALAAALLMTFGLGNYWAGLPYPKERYQTYQTSQSQGEPSFGTLPSASSPITKRTPCASPQSETESDLCAQWRAAKAAEKSAGWTAYGVIASAIGISLLLWQIILTRRAVKDTGDATIAMREANEIARKQQIAELILTDIQVWRCNNLNVKITASNIGNVTAKGIKLSTKAELSVKIPIIGSALHYTMKAISLGPATSESGIIHFGHESTILEANFYIDPAFNPLTEMVSALSIKNGVYVLLTGELEWISQFDQVGRLGFHVFCNDGKIDKDGVVWINHSRTSYHDLDKQ